MAHPDQPAAASERATMCRLRKSWKVLYLTPRRDRGTAEYAAAVQTVVDAVTRPAPLPSDPPYVPGARNSQ